MSSKKHVPSLRCHDFIVKNGWLMEQSQAAYDIVGHLIGSDTPEAASVADMLLRALEVGRPSQPWDWDWDGLKRDAVLEAVRDMALAELDTRDRKQAHVSAHCMALVQNGYLYNTTSSAEVVEYVTVYTDIVRQLCSSSVVWPLRRAVQLTIRRWSAVELQQLRVLLAGVLPEPAVLQEVAGVVIRMHPALLQPALRALASPPPLPGLPPVLAFKHMLLRARYPAHEQSSELRGLAEAAEALVALFATREDPEVGLEAAVSVALDLATVPPPWKLMEYVQQQRLLQVPTILEHLLCMVKGARPAHSMALRLAQRACEEILQHCNK